VTGENGKLLGYGGGLWRISEYVVAVIPLAPFEKYFILLF
jgi:hypothetical protein